MSHLKIVNVWSEREREREREIQHEIRVLLKARFNRYITEGESGYANWAHSPPTLIFSHDCTLHFNQNNAANCTHFFN
jgi:hypothetical protein